MSLYLGMEREILIVDPDHPADATWRMAGKQIAAITIDPHRPSRVFCGTYDQGLLRSEDGGETWTQLHHDGSSHVQSVAVSPVTPGLVFAGTEPSALYRSDDGGDTWHECERLRELPSAPTWSFPPKPHTSHVRWITPHPIEPDRLLVAIEAGALVQSRDSGATWQDRVPGGPYDSHTVHIHPARPERIVSAAGDGFFESDDGGTTWRRPMEGLPWGYCWGLAVDTDDPDTLVMSVAPNAGRGHGRRQHAQAVICQRSGGGRWQLVREGLPSDQGTTLSTIVGNPAAPGHFYALNNTGVYRSDRAGMRWERLDVPWKDAYLETRPPALAISR
jgi:hypothetical protein